MPKKFGSERYFSNTDIYVGNAGTKGRGVFANREFLKGDTIEISPVILVDIDQDKSYFDDFIFEWEDNTYAFALGFGSLYNHSASPNAVYFLDYLATSDLNDLQPAIEITALKKIKSGQEITVNYHGDPSCRAPWKFNESI